MVGPCPLCGVPVRGAAAAHCAGCGVPLGATATRIRGIDAEMARLQQLCSSMYGERVRLAGLLAAERDRQAEHRHTTSGAPAAGSPPIGVPPGPPAARAHPAVMAYRAEAAPASVQNVLLGLGGLLLGIAAVVFTVVGWSRFGIAGKAAILVVLTAVALAAPAALVRRQLRSSAETVGLLALLLTVLDAYAAWRLDLGGLQQLGGGAYAAAVSALLALGWVGYSLVVPLRTARPTAVLIGQLPLPLAALTGTPTPLRIALALLGTAAGDAVLDAAARRVGNRGAARALAALLGWAGWVVAALVTLGTSLDADGLPARPAGVLAVAAAVAVGWAASHPAGRRRDLAGSAAGLVAAAAALLLCWQSLGRWAPAAPAALAAAALSAALVLGPAWRGAARITGAVLAVAGGALPATGAAIAGAAPLAWLTVPWTGHGGPARQVLAPDMASLDWLPPPAAVPAAVLVAVAAAAAVASRPGRYRDGAGVGWAAVGAIVTVGGAVAVLLVPVSLDLRHPAALAVLGGGAAALVGLAAAVRGRAAAAVVGGSGLALAVVTLAWSLATSPATLTAFALAAVVSAAAAGTARRVEVRAAAAAVGLVAAGTEAGAGALAAGVPLRWAGFAVLAVAAAGAAGAALTASRPALASVATEVTAAVVALAGLAMTAGSLITASLGLAVLGVALAAVALRPDRRWLAPVGAAALLAAGWLALDAAGVRAIEAYTLPPAAGALLIGHRRRSGTGTSSWQAYGPGLVLALLPSLAAAWPDPGWHRPALLAAAALGITLAGARYRLQAPLALGATVLGLLGLREFGPELARVAGQLPRWVPLALAGALLVGLGVTYERRLRELRRARDAFGRLT